MVPAQGVAAIPGETDQLFIASENGNYAVEVTQDGCIDTSACYAVTNVGIDQNNFASGVALYPNPNTGDFIIQLGNPATGQLIIRNIAGQIVASQNFNHTNLIPFALEADAGIYFVEILTSEQEFALIKFHVK